MSNREINQDDVILRVEHLSQHFKFGSAVLKAVNDVSFDIKRGEVFGLVGESGCGKTTTGRTIIKLYNATDGNVYFDGKRICAGTLTYKNTKKEALKVVIDDIKYYISKIGKKGTEDSEKPDIKADFNKYLEVRKEQNAKIKEAKRDQKYCDKMYRREQIEKLKEEYAPQLESLSPSSEEYKKINSEYKEKLRIAKRERLVNQIQMIFQDPIASLDPRMTVKEIISEGLIIKGVRNKKEIDEQVYEMLEKVGLVREHAGRYPHEFSGGQRQRIGVARSIIMKPKLIIADEPVSALDVSIQAQVINLLNDLRNELGLTILFVAHDLSVVKYFSDRIGVMYFGNLVELADSEELFKHPLHPYTRSLLSAIPLPDPAYEKNRTRIVYNPILEHDYSEDKPELREVYPGHFVSCNNAEFEKIQKDLGIIK